jgi:hypothetical protein
MGYTGISEFTLSAYHGLFRPLVPNDSSTEEDARRFFQVVIHSETNFLKQIIGNFNQKVYIMNGNHQFKNGGMINKNMGC